MVCFLYIANCIIHPVKAGICLLPGLLACHFLFTYIVMPNIIVIKLGMIMDVSEYLHDFEHLVVNQIVSVLQTKRSNTLQISSITC